jgi:HicB family
MARAPSLAEDLASSLRISLTRSEEGGGVSWIADVEDRPGCSARGATPNDAVRHALAEADGSAAPAGTEATQSARRAGPREAAETKHSGRLLVRMPATLHDELARAAETEGVSLNQLITGVLAGAVEWRAGEKQGQRPTARPANDSAAYRLMLFGRPLPVPSLRVALAANFALVTFAALLAITLLLVAWQQS